MSADLGRREFIVALVALLMGIPRESPAAGPDKKGVRAFLFGPENLDRAPMLALVTPYLARNPGEGSIEALLTLLFGGVPTGDLGRHKERLMAALTEDFAAKRTVVLDGWILSITEVRLWCLYALLTA
jgi:hypothetical protein